MRLLASMPRHRLFSPALQNVQRADVASKIHISTPMLARGYRRASTDNPALLVESDVGRLYAVPNETADALNFKKVLPSRFARQLDTLEECVWLCRQHFLEARDYLDSSISPNTSSIRLVLWGQFGTGKSLTMYQLMHYAHSRGFVVYNVKNAMDYTRRTGKHMKLEMSAYREGRLDVQDLSVNGLALFKQQNSHIWSQLGSLLTERTYQWTKLEALPGGSPVVDIVETGLASAQLAPDCLGALERELRRHATKGSIRLLVAIDNANSLYGKIELTNEMHEIVRPAPHEVTLVHNTRKFLHQGWTNGACVLVADKAEMADAKDPVTIPRDSPLELFGVEGFSVIDPFIPIETKRYNEEEVSAIYEYYKERGWLSTDKARTEEGRLHMMYLSAFLPYYFERICAFN